MKIKEIVQVLDATVYNDGNNFDKELCSACASDLMSDVLAFSKCEAAILTGLNNPQVIRTAEMMDVICVIFVRNKKPSNSVIDLAKELGITVISTKLTMYNASGKLYAAGLNTHSHGEKNE